MRDVGKLRVQQGQRAGKVKRRDKWLDARLSWRLRGVQHGDFVLSLVAGGECDAARLEAVKLVRDGSGIPMAIDRDREFADAGRKALDELPPSAGVNGLNAAADYLLSSVEAAASV